MALLCGKQYKMQMQQDFGGGVYENRLWSPTAILVNVEGVRTRFKLKVASRNGLKHCTACASSFAVLEHDENTVAGYQLDNYGHVIKGETKHGNPCPVRLSHWSIKDPKEHTCFSQLKS